MKPLFTVHAGEYLVGSFIEQNYKRLNVWIPSRDTGVDLLVSDRRNRNAVSLQVKFSKDFLVDMGRRGAAFQKQLRAWGWWTIDRNKLQSSPADLWVLVLLGFSERTTDFVIAPPRELWRKLRRIHGSPKTIQSYLCVSKRERCWETRGLKRTDQDRVVNGEFRESQRDFTKWLNNWTPVAKLNR